MTIKVALLQSQQQVIAELKEIISEDKIQGVNVTSIELEPVSSSDKENLFILTICGDCSRYATGFSPSRTSLMSAIICSLDCRTTTLSVII